MGGGDHSRMCSVSDIAVAPITALMPVCDIFFFPTSIVRFQRSLLLWQDNRARRKWGAPGYRTLTIQRELLHLV